MSGGDWDGAREGGCSVMERDEDGEERQERASGDKPVAAKMACAACRASS